MILFFDTETTGFPNMTKPPEHPDQPHLVQIACLLTEDDGRERASVSLIVNPEVPIPPRATAVHGITDEIIIRMGIRPLVASMLLSDMMMSASLLVAHNAPFDWAIVNTLFHRENGAVPFGVVCERFCTMAAATPVLNLPPTDRMRAAGFTKPKSPKLEECIHYFFDEPLNGAHDAMVDVRACARVFFALRAAGAAP